MSGDGRYIATLEFPADFSTPPYVQVRDGATGAALFQVSAQTGGSGTTFGLAEFEFNPVLPLLAGAETPPGGISADQSAPVLLWDVANNRSAGQLAHPITVINLSFSGDGTKLATDSYENGSMNISLWDVGTQTRLSLVNTTPIRHFMGTPLDLSRDGMRAAVGYPDGSFGLWLFLRESGGQAYNVPLFDGEAGEVVSAVAFSPDDSMVAVAGGVPFSGGLSGEEQFPIYLLDAATGVTFARLEGHGSLIRDLAFTADGRFLISGGDSTVKFWGIPG
jgi:WD40 repeat protein